MTDKKSNDSRRKLLKSIAAGSGAVVAGKSFPESWSKPVLKSIILPAHASTTGGTYTIICSSLDVGLGSECEEEAISFYISGEVSASDGSSLEGVSLTVTYTNGAFPPEPTTTPGQTTTTPLPTELPVTFTVLVGAGNVFTSGELVAKPPGGGYWSDPAAIVSVKFTDPKYGSSTCSVDYECKGSMSGN